MIKSYLLIFFCLIFALSATSQNIGINSTGAAPNMSAMLDIDVSAFSTKLGLLIPRVTAAEKTAMNPLPSAAQGLVVYQTDGVQGFYYNTSITTTPAWSYLTSSSSGWATAGNTLTGTLPATPSEWIGSVNAADWVIKTNNSERMRVNSTGGVGINTAVASILDMLNVTSTTGSKNAIVGSITSAAVGSSYYGVGGNATNGAYTSSSGFLGYHNSSNVTFGVYGASGDLAGLFNGKVGINTAPSAINAADLEIRNTAAGATPATMMFRQTTSLGGSGVVMNRIDFGDNHQTTAQAQISILRGAAGGAGDLPTDIAFLNTPDASTTLTERMRILYNGNVGIGTSAPAATLDVSGSTKTTNFQMTNGATLGYVLQSNATGNASWVSPSSFFSVGTGLSLSGIVINSVWTVNGVNIFNNNSGGVGIGTNAPAEALHVVGNIRASSLAGTGVRMVQADANGTLLPLTAGTASQVLLGTGVWGSVPTNNAWSLLGNAGTTVGTNFIGTTDAQPFMIKVNSQKAGYIDYLNTNANTYIGYQALNVSTGTLNTVMGYQAAFSNTSGSSMVAIGQSSLFQNTFGGSNTAVGAMAMFSNTSGGANTSMGASALQNNLTGNYSTALGYSSGNTNNTGSNNLYLGAFSDASANNFSNATAVGSNAIVGGSNMLVLGGTGANAVKVGIGLTVPTQKLHVAGGSILTDAAYAASTVSVAANTAAFTTGAAATTQVKITDNGSGTANGAFTYGATAIEGQYLWITNLDAQSVTFASTAIPTATTMGFVYVNAAWRAVSANAAAASTDWSLTGNAGTTVGTNFIGTTDGQPLMIKVNNQKAGYVDYASLFSTALGYQALNVNAGVNNTALGYQALALNTSGFSNAAMGHFALASNTSGIGNAAFGQSAMYLNTSGTNNAAFGQGALYANITGGNNTTAGAASLAANTTGSDNTVMGTSALTVSTTASGNVAFGTNALTSSVAGSNATAIGTRAMQYANNTATPYTSSNVAVGYEALRGSATASANTGNLNTAIGYQSLWSNTTGAQNTASGMQALYSNTTGTNNTANGQGALYANTTGANNTATGTASLDANTTGADNTANGTNALTANTTGGQNTGIGKDALAANTVGGSNSALGYQALMANVGGTNNTAGGYQSLKTNVTGGSNTAYGYQSLYSNTGDNNTAIGVQTLFHNTGHRNTAIGLGALQSNIAGTDNVAVGYHALNGNNINTNQQNNVALGTEAGFKNQSGTDNVFIGNTSGWNNLSGSHNLFFGNVSGYNNISGYQNLFMGDSAGYSNTLGYNNIFMGNGAGYSNVGTAAGFGAENVFMGFNAGYNNTTGRQNSFIGLRSGYSNTTGSYNVFIGRESGVSNVNGTSNVFIGLVSGAGNVSGGQNTYVGQLSGGNNISGSNNSFFGNNAGSSTTTGGNNTMIGANTGAGIDAGNYNTFLGKSAGANGDYSKSIAIGYNAIVGANSSMVLGGTGADAVNVGIGTTTPAAKMDIEGTGGGTGDVVQIYNTSSSSSFKNTVNIGDERVGTWGLIIGKSGAATPASGYHGPDAAHIINVQPGNLNLGTSNAVQMSINAAGNVGIGTTAPSAKLEVCGNLKVIGTINASGVINASQAISCSSDRRYKKNILPLTNALSNVMKLQGVTYNFRTNEFPDKGFTDSLQIGLIAQDLEKIFPQMVFTDEKGFKSIDYSRLTPVLVEALKEQQKTIDTLTKTNTSQTESIEQLRAEVKAIQATLKQNPLTEKK